MRIKNMEEEVREQMPEGLSELGILRCLYIYLGKRKQFDVKYYFGDRKTKEKIYRLANQRLEDENLLIGEKLSICTSIAKSLLLLAKKFDISLELITDEEGIGAHMYNIAKLKDGRIIKLDLQQDLSNIHVGNRTTEFGRRDYLLTEISNEEIEEIDEKIGYKKIGKNYKDDDIKLLISQIKGKNKIDATDYILNNEMFLEGLKESDGYIELLRYVKRTLSMCVGESSVYVINLYRDEDINKQPLPDRQYSICVFARQKQKSNIYLFKKKERRFEKVEPERMKRLLAQGLKFERCLTETRLLKEIIYKKDESELDSK